jgi:hypothetical protein
LRCDVSRLACGGCDKTAQVAVRWVRPGPRFTAAVDALAFAQCKELPVRHTKRLLRCVDKQLWRHINHDVGQARARESFGGVELIGADETNLKRGQHYITVVDDLETKGLLFAAEGQDHRTLLEFADDLTAQRGEAAEVRHVCMDMSVATGLRTSRNFIAIADLRMSKLRHLPPSPLWVIRSPDYGPFPTEWHRAGVRQYLMSIHAVEKIVIRGCSLGHDHAAMRTLVMEMARLQAGRDRRHAYFR